MPYVEISAPGSGKTTRLVEAVEEYLYTSPNGVAVLVAETKTLAARNKGLVEMPFQERCVAVGAATATDLPASGGSELIRLFYDDFDRMPPGMLRVESNGYYVTTPERARFTEETEDFLMRLVAAAGGRYASHGFCADFEDLRRKLGEEDFRLKVLLHWLRVRGRDE